MNEDDAGQYTVAQSQPPLDTDYQGALNLRYRRDYQKLPITPQAEEWLRQYEKQNGPVQLDLPSHPFQTPDEWLKQQLQKPAGPELMSKASSPRLAMLMRRGVISNDAYDKVRDSMPQASSR